MRYYIADCHFFHDSLNVQMDHRGFSSGEEMNAHMLEKWNSRVRKRDEVVILGDLSLGGPEETKELLDRLNGHLYLIRGNHDPYGRKSGYGTERFEWIRDYAELHDNNRKVILCHYPIMFYNGQYRRRLPKTGGLPALFEGTGDPINDGEENGPGIEDAVAVGADRREPSTWMLYGHVHDTVDERLMREFVRSTRETVRTDREGHAFHIPCQMINCFCMYSDYMPLTLDEWIENDKKRCASPIG